MKTEAVRRFRLYRDFLNWRCRPGSVTPPPSYKQNLVRSYARRFGLDILVETGTFHGDMLAACQESFRAMYSIELNKDLYLKARDRFSDCPKINLVPGDSATVLPIVLRALKQSALYWLDAHAMVGTWDKSRPVTPIVDELRQLLAFGVGDGVILIDDARLFRRGTGYPTLEETESLVKESLPDRTFLVRNDVIRIYRIPKR